MKPDYKAAARGLAYSLAIKLSTTAHVERWLATLDSMLGDAPDDDVIRLERELLAEAWERLQRWRAEQGVCVDCDHRMGHDRDCPQYSEVEP